MGGNAEFEGIAVGPLGNRKFAFGRAGHPLLVDRADDNARSVGARQLQHLEEAFIAIFVVGGVKDAFATGHLEARLHLLPLGGVEHQGQVHIRDEPADQLMHVLFAVPSHIVDVDIEHVGILFDLAPGHGHQSIPILHIQQVTHLLRAAGIKPLANNQERLVLVVRGNPVNRRQGRFVAEGGPLPLKVGPTDRAGCRFELLGQLRQGANVGRGGAAAAADHLHAEIFHEVHQLHLHGNGC